MKEDDEPWVEWDAECPWQPWASQHDLIALMEMDAVWDQLPVNAAAVVAAGVRSGTSRFACAPGAAAAAAAAALGELDVEAAAHWEVHVLTKGYSSSSGRGMLGMRAVERRRQHVRLPKTGARGG